jgi:hypothetical protein
VGTTSTQPVLRSSGRQARDGRGCCIRRSRGEIVDPGWSDRQGQLVKGSQDPEVYYFLSPKFVVSAAEVLDERVPGSDHSRAAELFEAAHRSQSGL